MSLAAVNIKNDCHWAQYKPQTLELPENVKEGRGNELEESIAKEFRLR